MMMTVENPTGHITPYTGLRIFHKPSTTGVFI